MAKKEVSGLAINHLNTNVFDRMTRFLLDNANPSIVFHVKNDILKNITEEEKEALQKRVLGEKIIQRIIACQKENGWLGNGFHGSNKNAGQ